jgi:CRISPR-associated endonuclease Cas1
MAEGWGLRLRVRRGMLEVRDEAGPDGAERIAVLARAGPRGRRIVLLGRAGSISVEALRWCADADVPLALIDAAGGRVAIASGDPGADISFLRRAQARAFGSPMGLSLALYLIEEKLLGQARVLHDLIPKAVEEARLIEVALEKLANARTPDEVRTVEAAAALTYWQAWEGVNLTFARRDEPLVPQHWKRFGGRGSVLTGGSRLAVLPVNALLNYCYALAEIECRLACLIVGLDPGLGVLHADQRARDSMALDLLEPVRPEVDRFVLQLISGTTFGKRSFFETERGVLRVGAELARELAESLPLWRARAGPVAEKVARVLGGVGLPTPMTQTNRSTGRDPYRKAAQRARTRQRVAERLVPNACRECGEILRSRTRSLCDTCAFEHRIGVQQAGTANLSKMRAQGEADPARTPKARTKLGTTQARQARERAEWERTHVKEKPDPAVFRAEILPGLAGVPVAQIARETGLSTVQAWYIRRGERVPHPRFWPVLAALAGND